MVAWFAVVLRINSMSKAESNCNLLSYKYYHVIKNTTLSLINTTALLFVFISHHKSVETKGLRSTTQRACQLFVWWHASPVFTPAYTSTVVVLNVTANSMKTVVLQLSICQAFTFSNNVDTVTGPLSQHTASTCTFEDTKSLHLILMFCQQEAIEKHTSFSHSGSKKWAQL